MLGRNWYLDSMQSSGLIGKFLPYLVFGRQMAPRGRDASWDASTLVQPTLWLMASWFSPFLLWLWWAKKNYTNEKAIALMKCMPSETRRGSWLVPHLAVQHSIWMESRANHMKVHFDLIWDKLNSFQSINLIFPPAVDGLHLVGSGSGLNDDLRPRHLSRDGVFRTQSSSSCRITWLDAQCTHTFEVLTSTCKILFDCVLLAQNSSRSQSRANRPSTQRKGGCI